MDNKQYQVNPIAENGKTKGFKFGTRHAQALLMFFLLTVAFAIRICLSVGIVAMTDTTSSFTPTYDWDNKSTIMSSFFWGYMLTQIIAGQIAKNFGPKIPLCIAMTICSLFTILIPTMAQLGSYGVMICRVIQGMTQGFFFPGVANLLGKWVPPSERSRIGTFVYAGFTFGTVISMPITGWFCNSPLGWPSAFYFFGSLGLVWVGVWLFLGANSPSEHKLIRPEERDYIEASLSKKEEPKDVRTPWLSFLKSLPLWSLLLTHMAQNWGFWTLVTEIPIYINAMFDLDISSNGLLSAVPYLVMWISTFGYSSLADYLINRGILRTGTVRKILNSIGLYGPAVALIFMSFFGNSSLAVTMLLLILAVGLNAATVSGFNVNHVDLSPTHSGTLMGITNGFAASMSFCGPLLVQLVVTNEEDHEQWRIIFLTAAAVQTLGNTLFVLSGSGDVQKWDPSYDEVHRRESNKVNKNTQYGNNEKV
ncbi:sialin [Agrilus planipennis]|uniref:Putative inorganic phosphate cotransporter n=1 Tax=Agrilus planipennis TaxID=224129 RepID=A0A1W4WUY7_AGRPL|nr:sialin [Agrilus planipennis]